jgi:hypothetical protein
MDRLGATGFFYHILGVPGSARLEKSTSSTANGKPIRRA